MGVLIWSISHAFCEVKGICISEKLNTWISTGCPQKNLRLLWKAISPLRIFVVIKVRGDSGSTVAEISVEYHNFPVAQQGAEIFEFKVDPVP